MTWSFGILEIGVTMTDLKCHKSQGFTADSPENSVKYYAHDSRETTCERGRSTDHGQSFIAKLWLP